MPEWGTMKDENHPHFSLPRRGGGEKVAIPAYDGKKTGYRSRPG